ncbi:MAG: membrane protein insertion efficiency factor YidD [Actinomycetota bacterium]|nr:membrane protein insertion efficiency factor YidD [Actinomycetota bacterium]
MTPPARLLAGAIALYRRFVSPFLPPSCRYEPSCSAYALEAIRLHGAVRGSVMALRRVARCHPWGPGGIDRVPVRRAAP